eukprot:COSAG05_NODE_3820_length_1820_cov_1.901220_4_plen_86_part_00
MAVELQGPVKQWGLLSWNKRWLTYGASMIKLYKSEDPPTGDQSPIVEFDLSQSGVCTCHASTTNPRPCHPRRAYAYCPASENSPP